MRDYSSDDRGLAARYGTKRHPEWFQRLKHQDQALFVPIDVYAHRFARRHRVSDICRMYTDVRDIQQSPELHREAATEIAAWAGKKGFDPRDVNVYWYSLGAGDIHEDGTPTE